MARQAKSKEFHFRLSEDQLAMLECQAASAGMTKTRYITYLIEREYKARQVTQHAEKDTPDDPQQPILVYKDADLRKIIWQLSKWGNNLNQATRAINAVAGKKFFSEAKMAKVLEEALHRIELSETAITKIADNITKLQDEQHVVMGD